MFKWHIPAGELAGHSGFVTEVFTGVLALTVTVAILMVIIYLASSYEAGDEHSPAPRSIFRLLVAAAVLLVISALMWGLDLGNATSKANLLLGWQRRYEWDVFFLMWKHLLMVMAAGVAFVAVIFTRQRVRTGDNNVFFAVARWSPAYLMAIGVAMLALIIPA